MRIGPAGHTAYIPISNDLCTLRKFDCASVGRRSQRASEAQELAAAVAIGGCGPSVLLRSLRFNPLQ